MKTLTISAGLLIVALAGIGLATAAASQDRYLFWGILALGLYLSVRTLLTKKKAVEVSASLEETPVEEKPKPSAPPLPGNAREAAVITFLGLLQEKGRLVDFLMDDITRYNDAQVGAAARVVHEGCKAALTEHLRVEPVSAGGEGGAVTVPVDAPADAYRLVGQVSGEAPFSGKLVHKGWQAASIKLPRTIAPDESRLPVIAPAQVELK